MPDNNIPWIEKYRPSKFENIVLNQHNTDIMNNMIETNTFPNLLLYGPPGTGKTTTIINFINKYQKKYNEEYKELKIHLNASDERGIDIIRNQIYNFVDSKSLFCSGTKFVILDEVDYMTKNAQQALKYLMQQFNTDVRFCLICNYISKIDSMLRNEFLCIRFHHLPREKIRSYLNNIIVNEKLEVKDDELVSIMDYYNSDIRSMINHLQSQQHVTTGKVLNDELWDEFTIQIQQSNKDIVYIFREYCNQYNKDEKNMIKNYIYFLIKNVTKINNISKFISFVENLLHSKQNIYTTDYFLANVGEFL
jgi:replication factor C subunit 3/5